MALPVLFGRPYQETQSLYSRKLIFFIVGDFHDTISFFMIIITGTLPADKKNEPCPVVHTKEMLQNK
jgi:hypothetical protein